jgi:hypothetical protein
MLLGSCTLLLGWCRKLFCLEEKYKDVSMGAKMMVGAGQILPLAWGTAQIENIENWSWFALQPVEGGTSIQQESHSIHYLF